jgi:hypothetical protein
MLAVVGSGWLQEREKKKSKSGTTPEQVSVVKLNCSTEAFVVLRVRK